MKNPCPTCMILVTHMYQYACFDCKYIPDSEKRYKGELITSEPREFLMDTKLSQNDTSRILL